MAVGGEDGDGGAGEAFPLPDTDLPRSLPLLSLLRVALPDILLPGRPPQHLVWHGESSRECFMRAGSRLLLVTHFSAHS